MTKDDYAVALRSLISLAQKGGGSTAERTRQFLLALLIDDGSLVALGALLRSSDCHNRDAIVAVMAGWHAYGWRGIEGAPHADDFIAAMTRRAA